MNILIGCSEDPILQSVARNILDEPIAEATKKRLLKPLLPLLPKPIPAPRKRKLEKRQSCVSLTRCMIGVKRSQLLSLVTDQDITKPPHYTLLREVGAGALTDYGAMVPVGHRLEADALAFLNTMTVIEKITIGLVD